MHLAIPNKKSPTAPSYSSRSSRFSALRRNRIKATSFLIFAIVALLYIFWKIAISNRVQFGRYPVVIVTVLDHGKLSNDYIEAIKENRIDYAKKHGYATFFPNISDYELNGAPSSWARVPAIRHALTQYDHCKFVWYLSHNSVIMNPTISVEEDIMDPLKLESLMLRNYPIVPPSSVIKTFQMLKGTNIDLVLTQDKTGLALGSFIIRRGCWAKFFLDTWFDPLYRSYNFQKAHVHALEHIVQWHPTILSKLAIIPQKILNSYIDPNLTSETGRYSDGDFVVELAGCDLTGRDCATEAWPYLKKTKSR
ncbi:putative alpha-1,2-galactosyltransferase C8D2.17 [Golovinomyces cichoracearum]|uniref:Putative alpha-1,2-galactosyltransferase C8D2.17 n=1 Tax=Golovinomyces cichoracearum TaxID=62708 RepID=A0A420HKG8_9PEZI|nr:putative alpha-1,2-galactosyltransferase C8D2.17 [Golovinomyces cichoracearum]